MEQIPSKSIQAGSLPKTKN